MKTTLRITGIFLLALSIFLIVVAGIGEKAAQPNEVRYGTVIGGVYSETGRGTIGGNSEMESTMQLVRLIGIMGCVVGLSMFVGSFLIEDKATNSGQMAMNMSYAQKSVSHYCTCCGHLIGEGQVFCVACGRRI